MRGICVASFIIPGLIFKLGVAFLCVESFQAEFWTSFSRQPTLQLCSMDETTYISTSEDEKVWSATDLCRLHSGCKGTGRSTST